MTGACSRAGHVRHQPQGPPAGLRFRRDQHALYAELAITLRHFVGGRVGTSEANLDDACGFAWTQLVATSPSIGESIFAWLAQVAIREGGEISRVGVLAALPARVRAIVVHPDTITDPAHWRCLGRRLVIENMDARKASGQTADDLEDLFDALPEAGLCFDIAHAKHVDDSLAVGREILDRFTSRLRHVHLSSLDGEGHHIRLTDEDELLFAELLDRCRDVPWILEAPLH